MSSPIRSRPRRRSRCSSMLLAALCCAASVASHAATVPAPVITSTGADSYRVSYSSCSGCAGHGLEEYLPASNSWSYVGSGTLNVSGRAPGSYRYRTVYMTAYGYGNYFPSYSSTTTVTVAGPGGARADLSAQFEAEYRGLRGDIDGDGRVDLLLSPTGPAAGVAPGPVLLRQGAGGSVTTRLATAGEANMAAGWPAAAVGIGVRDVNIDGTADLVLRGVDRVPGLEQVGNQIIFASDSAQPGGTLAHRPVDASLARFSRDINRHLVNPDYYPNNAPIRYGYVASYSPVCYRAFYNQWTDMGFLLQCYLVANYYYVAYRDFSVFDPEAMRIASDDYGMIHDYIDVEPAMERIESTLERVLGVVVGGWDINELLGGQDALDDPQRRRGTELFVVLAGISEAAAEEGEGEGQQGPVDTDRVLLKGRRIISESGPIHTAVEYHGSTISAYDSDSRLFVDGLLVSEVNWVRDRPELTMLLGYVDGPAAPTVYWGTMLARDAAYDDNLPYDLLPSIGQGGYNSNSFVSGLIQATLGQSTVPMSNYIGGERPVPAGAFN